MLFFGIKNVWFRLGVFLVLTIWTAALIGWMSYSFFVTHPFKPELTGTLGYGQTGENDLKSYIVLTSIEYLVLSAVLLPYSFSRYYWVRPLVLQIPFGFWLLAMMATAMHSSHLHGIHMLWLLGVNGIIFILLVASIVAESIGADKNRAIRDQQWNNSNSSKPNN